MSYHDDRSGHGRWTPVIRPAVGILWTTDAGALGFIPQNGVDPTPVLTMIDTYDAAGKTARDAFDELLLAIGSAAKTGDVDNWQEDRINGRRVQLGPELTSTYGYPQ